MHLLFFTLLLNSFIKQCLLYMSTLENRLRLLWHCELPIMTDKPLPPVGRLQFNWPGMQPVTINSNAINSTGRPCVGAASQLTQPTGRQRCEVLVYIQVSLFKMSCFGNDYPYRHKNYRCSGHGRRAAACLILPSYDVALRRSLETEKMNKHSNIV